MQSLAVVACRPALMQPLAVVVRPKRDENNRRQRRVGHAVQLTYVDERVAADKRSINSRLGGVEEADAPALLVSNRWNVNDQHHGLLAFGKVKCAAGLEHTLSNGFIIQVWGGGSHGRVVVAAAGVARACGRRRQKARLFYRRRPGSSGRAARRVGTPRPPHARNTNTHAAIKMMTPT